jgi:hypothetical protein
MLSTIVIRNGKDRSFMLKDALEYDFYDADSMIMIIS